MQKVQKTYTQEFKREAVRLAQTSGKPITHVARELGISDISIPQWRKELTEHGPEAFPGSGHQTAKARGTAPTQTGVRENARSSVISSKKLWPSSRNTSCEIAVQRRASARESSQPADVETLDVSVSGDSPWRKRPMSQPNREDGQLAEKVKAAFPANLCVSVRPRGHAELHAQGINGP